MDKDKVEKSLNLPGEDEGRTYEHFSDNVSIKLDDQG